MDRSDSLDAAQVTGLLGRRPIDVGSGIAAYYLAGRRVLVTGAGSSIGVELCRQIARCQPSGLIVLDRDESALRAVRLALHGELVPQVVLADVRDSETLNALFLDRRPDVVFHAAALQDGALLEEFPDEAWKTNVLGTRNVLEAATSVGVSHFVNLSTDEAADPAGVLGRTARMAEQLTASYAERADGAYLSVRIGTVLDGCGSLLDTFTAQVGRGGPLTLNDPAATRHLTTVAEAVPWVLRAGAIGGDGEALVLDTGAPVRLADLAGRVVKASGRAIDVVHTGLRPGEQLHASLVGGAERARPTRHPLISRVPVTPLDDGELQRVGRRASDRVLSGVLGERVRVG